MKIDKAVEYTKTCPSCLSVITFKRKEIVPVTILGMSKLGIVCPECGNAIEIRQNPPNPNYSTQDQHVMLAYPILQSKIDQDKAAEALKQKLEEE